MRAQSPAHDQRPRSHLHGPRIQVDNGSAPPRKGRTRRALRRNPLGEALRDAEAFIQTILASLKDPVALLDEHGTILAVNAVWNRFGLTNGTAFPACIHVGANYLDVCRRGAERADESAQQALAGIQSVLRGERQHFVLEYQCPSPSDLRRFAMLVTPLSAGRGGVVITHADTTEQTARQRVEEELHTREMALQQSQEELRLLAGRLLAAQEEERRWLAHAMRDDLSQRLAALAIEVGAIEQQLASAAGPVVEKLRAVREQIMKLATHTHAISRQLHPSILEDLGVAAALTPEGASFSRREGVLVTDEAEDVPGMVPKDEAIGLHCIAKDLLRVSMDRSPAHLRPPPTLTPRQREVMQLFAEGHSAKEVAAIMHISTRTVEFHKYRAMEILGLRTSAELIHYAIKHGIVTV